MRLFETSYRFETHELLQKTKTQILMLMIYFFMVIFLVFAGVRLINGNYLGAGLDVVGSVVMSGFLLWVKRSRSSYDILSRVILAVALIVIFTTTYYEQAFARGFAWALTVLILAFYLRDRKEGLIWGVLLASIVTFNYFSVSSHVLLLEYVAFVVSLVTISIITFVYEHLKEGAQKSAIQQEEQKFLQSVIDSAVDPIMVIDTDYNVTLYNKAVAQEIDWEVVADKEHIKCYEISHRRTAPCDSADHPCPLRDVMETQKHTNTLHIHKDSRGDEHYVELSASPHLDKDGNVIGIIEIARDITDRIEIENRLQVEQVKLSHLANHDPLTNLPNRLLFHDRVQQAIKRARRNFTQFVVFFIDLDRFKAINDSLGHDIGDKVLLEVTERLKSNIREADTISRLGGDEFAMVIDSTQHLRDVEKLAEKVLELMRKPMTIDAQELYTSCSIGISLFPNDGESPEMLFRNADAAVHRAKEEGKNHYCFYTADMTEEAFERVLMESSLRRALENDEFRVFYQPQVDARTQQHIGMEALVRWQHPEHGLIGPDRFIKMAEETGLIGKIDQWVMLHACKQLRTWHDMGLDHGKLSLNVSMKLLHSEGFFDFLNQLIVESRCHTPYMELEITESQIMHRPEQVVDLLNRIIALGISISVDDFGTGYSSLAYLKRLPVDKLKIDQSFIRDLPDDEEDIAITKAIIALANSLKLNVIAEGVETQEQRAFLLQEGCEHIQGYLYGKPMPSDAFRIYLKGVSDL